MEFPKEPRVAVIGAGISGVVAAGHLIKAGLDVTVFERAPVAGGIWVYNERKSSEPYYPATKPSKGELVPTESLKLEDSLESQPGPCYVGLKNNVSTRLLELTLGKWPEDTEEYVSHDIIKAYIQTIARESGVEQRTRFNTAVTKLEKADGKWQLEWSSKKRDSLLDTTKQHQTREAFDSVVISTGHYHAPRVPDIPGLSEWKSQWPGRVQHSKGYREPEPYRNKNVLLIGAGVSSMDIAKESAPIAKHVFQSFRSGSFDLPATMLPENSTRVGEIAAFEYNAETAKGISDGEHIPFDVILKSGQRLCGIDDVVICTGYHITLPFLAHLHEDDTPATEASDTVIVTDGTQYHNLHKDIFYIPDPTLAFVGAPYYTATFTLFEFQAIILAAVVSGQASVPSEGAMREEYRRRLVEKGAGRSFHSLRGIEEDYVNDMLAWVNSDLAKKGLPLIPGHTPAWFESKEVQRQTHEKVFANVKPIEEEEVARRLSIWAAC